MERIICAAIHYNDIVIGGHRHRDCHCTLKALRPELEALVERKHQGFITSTGRYVERNEAMKIAKAADQLIRPDLHEGVDSDLTSEDLY